MGEVEVGAHVLRIVCSLMRIWSSCSHHRTTSMITWREPIFQTSPSSVICNPRSSDWILLWQILFTAVALFLWLRLSGHYSLECKNVHSQSYPSERTQTTTCTSLLCQLLPTLKEAEVHRVGKHLAIIEPCGRPVNLFSALTWECVETYELLHNYMYV